MDKKKKVEDCRYHNHLSLKRRQKSGTVTPKIPISIDDQRHLRGQILSVRDIDTARTIPTSCPRVDTGLLILRLGSQP